VCLFAETRPLIGRLAERVLVLALAEQLTLTEIGERLAGADPATGRISKHMAGMYAWTFRQALETLGEEWDERGAQPRSGPRGSRGSEARGQEQGAQPSGGSGA
jgi:hypothetical protein